MKVHHVGFLVKNLEKSERQSMDLGYKIEFVKRFDPIRNVNIEFLLNDNYRIELIEPVNKTSELFSSIKKYKNQPYHICYITDDINKTIDELLDKHFIVIKTPETAPCIENKKVAFLSGVGIELIELLEEREEYQDGFE